MNRYREDTTYIFRPPKYSRFWAPLILRMSDRRFLRKAYRMTSVKVAAGGDELRRLYTRGDSLLIAPNHSDHCDPHTLLHLSRRFNVPLHFMAAREIFEKLHGFNGKILQRAGVFSIDREGTDLKSIKEAMNILHAGRFPLVMFPEGEIYHLNERLTPLNEGVATLALRTAKRLAKDGGGKTVHIVPTAMRYSYVDDISASFPERLARLERHILWQPQSHLDPIRRVFKFGEAVLALKEKEFLDRIETGSLESRLAGFREKLIAEQEQFYFGEVGEGALPMRVRRVRGRIRQILLAPEKPAPEVIAQCYRSLDRIYVAVQLYSYPARYLEEDPSMDRIAETLHKFEEDFFHENRIRGRRTVAVTFCPPINAMDYLPELEKDPKATVTHVTHLVESAIRKVLEPCRTA